jgi:hypothetical protein
MGVASAVVEQSVLLRLHVAESGVLYRDRVTVTFFDDY